MLLVVCTVSDILGSLFPSLCLNCSSVVYLFNPEAFDLLRCQCQTSLSNLVLDSVDSKDREVTIVLYIFVRHANIFNFNL